jgi:TPR repeat protein
MKLRLKHAVATFVLVLSFAAPVAAGPLEDATAAYYRGDFATALRLLRPLAEQGDAAAQYNLGQMYLLGHGVPKNNAEAVTWYRKAADQGDAAAEVMACRRTMSARTCRDAKEEPIGNAPSDSFVSWLLDHASFSRRRLTV